MLHEKLGVNGYRKQASMGKGEKILMPNPEEKSETV